MKRFARVVFGVNASPFLLNGKLKHYISSYREVNPEFVAKMLQSLYVDDLNTGGDGVLDGFEFYGKAKSRMKEGSFNLRKWMSNSSELLRLINESEGSSEVPAKSVLEEGETYATSLSGPCGTEGGENEHKTLGVWRLPFVTQYQPSVPNLKQILLDKWHLIEQNPALKFTRENRSFHTGKGVPLKIY